MFDSFFWARSSIKLIFLGVYARRWPKFACISKFVCILCLWLRIIRSSHQGFYLMNFLSQIFLMILIKVTEQLYLWLLQSFLAVATYHHYKKVRRTIPLQLYPAFLKKYIFFTFRAVYSVCYHASWGLLSTLSNH